MNPRLLDLFCGAGGAGMGYSLAGFDVVGVDIRPQPHYPFEFHLADATTYDLSGFDAIHASPPCQRFSKSVSKKNRLNHPDFIHLMRERLNESDALWVIENVPGAPLEPDAILCGTQFGLGVKRHRIFETGFFYVDAPPPCRHSDYTPQYPPAWNRTTPLRFRPISGGWTGPSDLELDKQAMGVTWDVTPKELSESIPPAYTRWVGAQMLERM